MLAAFLGNTKLILGSVVTFVVGIFLVVFKARGKEIEEQKEEIESLKKEKKFNEALKSIGKKIKEGFDEEEREIEETYNDKKEVVYKTTDKPLSPTLLSKLRDSQGISDRDTSDTK